MSQKNEQALKQGEKGRKWLLLVLIVVSGVALDQGTKWWVVQTIAPHEVIPVIPGLFNLVHVYNQGAAFGILSTWDPFGVWVFFIVVNCLILGVLGYLYWRTSLDYPLFLWAYSLVITGAIGNLSDRLRLGAVVDFLDFYLGRHHWPAFNVADSLICIGAPEHKNSAGIGAGSSWQQTKQI